MRTLLVGCETSGRVRDAFRRYGINAWSCDLLPCKADPKFHIQGDVIEALDSRNWDAAILHPTCTYLTGAAEWAFNDPDFERYPGVGYHQKTKPGTPVGAERRELRRLALAFVRELMAYGSVMRVAIENPVGAISKAIRKPEQIVQPYEFGDDASKKTCLWLDGLPRLVLDPAQRVAGRIVNGRECWANQTDTGQNRVSPGEDRWAERSVTYAGIAEAMAAQWSGLL